VLLLLLQLERVLPVALVLPWIRRIPQSSSQAVMRTPADSALFVSAVLKSISSSSLPLPHFPTK
jgi:hypothetical protein